MIYRKQLCPDTYKVYDYGFLRHLYYHDRETRECYELGTKGPCGKNMLFFKESDNELYGHCDCRQEGPKGRTLVYSSKSRQCHFLCGQVSLNLFEMP